MIFLEHLILFLQVVTRANHFF